MKRKKVIIIVGIILFLMLIPIPIQVKNGDKKYKALLYEYTKIHRHSDMSFTGYEDGWELKILGIHVGGSTNVYVSTEHRISIKLGDKVIEAQTGSFCYQNGLCLDKIDFQDFKYDVIKSSYNSKLYIENLDGTIKKLEIFDYSSRNFIDVEIEFTDEYIVTPNISGLFIIKMNAIYEGKSIEYYFMINISKTDGKDIALNIKIKENTLTSVGLTMIVENLSDRDLEYGTPYYIEKYENGFWKSAPLINDLSFNLPAFSLNKGEAKELSINWEYSYGKLKGKYRVVKEFSYQENDDYISFDKYLEFEIK